MTDTSDTTGLVQLRSAAKSAAGVFVLRVASAGLGFLISVMLARLLGATGLGVFAFASAWISVLMIPATLGLQQLLPREVAIYCSRQAWGELRGLMAFSYRTVLFVATILAVAAAITAWYLARGRTLDPTIATFWIALVLLPLGGLVQIRQSAMRGLGHVVLGQLPESILAPVAMVLALLTIYLLRPDGFSPISAITITVAVAAFAQLVGNRLLAKVLPNPVGSAESVARTREWIASAIPMAMITGLEVINTQMDLIMLGAIVGERAAGLYAPAVKGAALVVFVWASVNMAIGPVIARAFHHGAHRALQSLIHKSALVIFMGTLPIWSALFVFHAEFLTLFGSEFGASRTALRILLVGNLVNSLAGSVGLILKMTGNERDVLWTGLCAASVNIGLNAVLIPNFGIEGAATATAISTSIWPVAAGIIVYRRTAINPTIFPILRTPTPERDTGA